jgi:hypothetical protein
MRPEVLLLAKAMMLPATMMAVPAATAAHFRSLQA